MIWLTWRQFRTPALVTGALLGVLLAALALTWGQVAGMASRAGFTGCQGDACGTAASTFLESLRQHFAGDLNLAGIATLILLPVLLGIFWGAPLVARELETGTYRMVFSQSVSRGRWLLVKLVAGVLAAALGAGLLSLMLSAWSQPIDAASGDRLNPLVFGVRGVVPVGYAVFAFVAGVTAGLLLRRTLAAMVVTLMVVVGVQLAGPMVVRPLLADPVTTIAPFDVDGRYGISMNGDTGEMRLQAEAEVKDWWVLSNTTITSSGAEFTGPADTTLCGPEAPRDHETCPGWLAAQNLSQEVRYVPGEQFWALQWREFGLLIVFAAALSLFSLWWIRHRPA